MQPATAFERHWSFSLLNNNRASQKYTHIGNCNTSDTGSTTYLPSSLWQKVGLLNAEEAEGNESLWQFSPLRNRENLNKFSHLTCYSVEHCFLMFFVVQRRIFLYLNILLVFFLLGCGWNSGFSHTWWPVFLPLRHVPSLFVLVWLDCTSQIFFKYQILKKHQARQW